MIQIYSRTARQQEPKIPESRNKNRTDDLSAWTSAMTGEHRGINTDDYLTDTRYNSVLNS